MFLCPLADGVLVIFLPDYNCLHTRLNIVTVSTTATAAIVPRGKRPAPRFSNPSPRAPHFSHVAYPFKPPRVIVRLHVTNSGNSDVAFVCCLHKSISLQRQKLICMQVVVCVCVCAATLSNISLYMPATPPIFVYPPPTAIARHFVCFSLYVASQQAFYSIFLFLFTFFHIYIYTYVFFFSPILRSVFFQSFSNFPLMRLPAVSVCLADR